jgi:hypothetical protein
MEQVVDEGIPLFSVDFVMGAVVQIDASHGREIAAAHQHEVDVLSVNAIPRCGTFGCRQSLSRFENVSQSNLGEPCHTFGESAIEHASKRTLGGAKDRFSQLIGGQCGLRWRAITELCLEEAEDDRERY